MPKLAPPPPSGQVDLPSLHPPSLPSLLANSIVLLQTLLHRNRYSLQCTIVYKRVSSLLRRLVACEGNSSSGSGGSSPSSPPRAVV